MIWLWIAIAVVLGIPLLLYGIGLAIPRDHVARVSIELAAPPARVWDLITDVGSTARWRDDVQRIEMLPSAEGRTRFREHSKQGAIGFEVVSQEPPRRQVVRVLDEDQPFGGTWTFEIEPGGGGTRLSITEEGFVKSPIFRAIGKVFFSPTDTLMRYERALARELGERAEPRVH